MKDLRKNLLVIKYVFRFCPLYALFTFLYIVFQTSFVVCRVYVVKMVVKLVSLAINNNGSIKDIILLMAIYLVIIVICQVYISIYNSYIRGKYRLIYIHKMRTIMFEKSTKVDYEAFDNPEFYDMYSRAMRDGVHRGIRVYEDLTNLISAIVSTLALGSLIIVENYLILVIIVVSVLIRIIILNIINKNTYKFDKETEKDRRMYEYVKRIFYQERFAQEIKSTTIGDLLIDQCYDAKKNIDKKYKQTYGKNVYLSNLQILINNLFEKGLIYIYLIYLLINGLPIEVFTEMISATSQFSNNLVQMGSFINQIKINALYIDFFLDFMNYKPKLETLGTKEITGDFEQIEIKNLDFRYPFAKNDALNNINLILRKREKIAIVGLNGAGKSTLIKLLIKFYNPSNGLILYNGIDIKDVKVDCIRSKYSILFQENRIFGVTIGENILMRKIETKQDEELILKALENVDMKERILALPLGINTVCTKEFRKDGAEFSGGELQRLSIARVFASNAQIYILDEPTSALDPLSERNINKLIMEKSPDKAMIIIAHRLSTVVDADKIVLMEYGRIVEEGTHEELMKKQGKYYEMFTSQGALYKRSIKSEDQ